MTTGCAKCAVADKRNGKWRPADEPCDICAGRGYDYIGRDCRHCRPSGFGRNFNNPLDRLIEDTIDDDYFGQDLKGNHAQEG